MADLEGLIARMDAFIAAAESGRGSIAGIGGALDGINSSVLDGGNSMNALAASIEGVAGSAQNLLNMFDQLVSIIPGLGGVGDAMGTIGTAFRAAGSVIGSFVGAIDEAAGVMDGLTGISRDTSRQLFEVSAGFGGAYKAAWDYKNLILDMASTLSTYDFGFIRQSEVNEMFGAARAAKLSLEDLTATITTSDGTMQAYAAGILQASSMSLELSAYAGLLGDAIYGQGLSTKEAMYQISAFRDVSDDTGVSLVDVTDTLQGLSRQFRTLGIQADFGEPILRGFAKSLSDIGLGAENAKALTEDLGSSLTGIATDPALAYITAQFGGLSYGQGGTALGAGIDMQARLLEAEKTGDQAAVGFELANAMRDMIASFGAGSITTISEATDLAEGKNVRNSTQGWQDAMSAKVDSAIIELSVQSSALQFLAQHAGRSAIDIKFDTMSTKIEDALGPLGEIDSKLLDKLSSLGITPGSEVSSRQLERLFGNMGDQDIGNAILTRHTAAAEEGAAGTPSTRPRPADNSDLLPSLGNIVTWLQKLNTSVESLRPLLETRGNVPGTI